MHAGYLPGFPASHGCIRLPAKMAVLFFDNASVGTPVEIRATADPVLSDSARALSVTLAAGDETRTNISSMFFTPFVSLSNQAKTTSAVKTKPSY